MRKKATRKQPYFTMESAMTAILCNASGKTHHRILFAPPLRWGRMFKQSPRSCVQGFQQCNESSNFRKPLLVYLETLRQVGKIDCAKGQIQCSNTCTLDPFQNLFPFSYFLSLQLFLCQVFQCILIKGLFLKHVAFFWCLYVHGFIGQACRINRRLLILYFILTRH